VSGITILDRRDLDRLLKGIVHASKRDDVKVEVKYYVQFTFAGDQSEMGVQTIVDPYSGFNRSSARSLVKQAIERLDAEERKGDSGSIVQATQAAGTIPAEGAS